MRFQMEITTICWQNTGESRNGWKGIDMKLKWDRVLYDLQYVVLNQLVCRIPCWTVRRKIYIKYGMQLGKDARIGIRTMVICPQNIKIGARTVVNENCVLDGRGGLSIGHDTSISMFCKILSASHDMESVDFSYRPRRTLIGSHVWLGTSSIVLDGARVGDFAVIGAGAVVKKAVGRQSVMAGNPAREIRKRRLDKPYSLRYKAYFR